MNIVECTSQEEWTAFVASSLVTEHASFLQSWEWGEMQKKYGRKVERLLVKSDDTVIAAAQCVRMSLQFGKEYVLCPRGPVISEEGPTALIIKTIQNHFKGSAIFLRCEPVGNHLFDATLSGDMTSGLRKVEDMQPAVTRMIDLSEEPEYDVLLAAMKQKTRYNIRLAAKKRVKVEFVTGDWEQTLEEFWTILEETSSRHGIRNHPKAYYRAMFTELGNAGVLEIVKATHEGDVLAMNIVVKYGSIMTYLHGASTHHKKKLMAPYALQWESIKRAKELGYDFYDFYGVAPEDASEDHYLAGVTRFKTGFGGEVMNYAGTYEFPISALWYKIYRTVKALRK